MGNWRDQVLREFAPNVAQLTLVADPDHLLVEEEVLVSIRARDFELIPFDDHIAFRFLYESKFRSRWDQGDQTDLVIVLHSQASALDCLPHDLLQIGRRLSFSLGDIFPSLSYPIVAALDRADLDPLYEAQRLNRSIALGNYASIEFILRHVFGIVPELIKDVPDLLRVLLRRHYREQRIPVVMDRYLVQRLGRQDSFRNWPLEKIVPDKEEFFSFLQERWPHFLNQLAGGELRSVGEGTESYLLNLPGPMVLPFDHSDIRVYVDNLFREGLLEAVPFKKASTFANSWIAIGIKTDDPDRRSRRLDGLLETVAASIPGDNSRHDDWCRFAKTWAELLALALESDTSLSDSVLPKMQLLQTQIDAALVPWLTRRYRGLIDLPAVSPAMLHHIPRFLSRYINEAKEHKVGLVLIDGLSLDQWIVIRKELVKQRAYYRFREEAVFAWIPTTTFVSRQATFAGKQPIYFPDNIDNTNREPNLWSQFWIDEGLAQLEIGYAKGSGDGTLKNVEEMVVNPKMRVVGLVVDKVDKIMHGMQLGTMGMHNQVRQWADQPFLADLFDLLLNNGFRVYLTSDHGNIEAVGCGRPSEGAIAEVRGERSRIYSDKRLRRRIRKRFPDAIEWPSIGLPDNYLPLLAPGRSAFVRESERRVSHGGASLEELIVPFVQVEMKDT